ncbi:MAG: hypothetical protein V8R40_03210 [Dysosmobacter sp.]
MNRMDTRANRAEKTKPEWHLIYRNTITSAMVAEGSQQRDREQKPGSLF